MQWTGYERDILRAGSAVVVNRSMRAGLRGPDGDTEVGRKNADRGTDKRSNRVRSGGTENMSGTHSRRGRRLRGLLQIFESSRLVDIV